ncbi:MAG: quinol:cytochrome C oxidoreductase, partial [Planctomycetaceae bacterium]|nr:quinol:cytochrome C oxidoreductase [Planctomycetaceae bacterium]
SCFWMYIWFSQYMLIWYSNIPEETSYFMNRTHGPWGPIVIVSIVLNWFVPFFLLLPKPAKRNRTVMARVATVLLIGRWVDLYVMVFPSVLKQPPVFGVWEVAGLVCFSAVAVLLVDRTFRLAEPVPVGDPYLSESLHYHA